MNSMDFELKFFHTVPLCRARKLFSSSIIKNCSLANKRKFVGFLELSGYLA